ncbi:CDP-alcohol phosphatidyltransferase family protein [Tundrisphaera lichenicola]|uniref:CDP-alcohol phosphatidyltransferase family protein n=1 Tax=Tundrisphaera lichenicola TaxID=2029860 RepID=UPI003EB6EB89
MIRPTPQLVIDARHRGPRGPLASERVLGRPILEHLLELAGHFGDGPVAVHARLDEHEDFRAIMGQGVAGRFRMVTGPPPENAAILRSDRLYDTSRLRKALRRGRDPESAVIWRLDRPRDLAGADDELIRRRTYQPIGRFWALGPARFLARLLKPTRIRPNQVTIASASLVLGASVLVANAGDTWMVRVLISAALAIALILDTADGHLARLQGTASEFGRWLDANLDELGDMALHAAVAWSAFVRDGQPAWLVAGMLYAMGKYLFVVGSSSGVALDDTAGRPELPALSSPGGRIKSLARIVGHADVRWHLWIALAAVGRLDAALIAYALYFPGRAMAGAWRKAEAHA